MGNLKDSGHCMPSKLVLLLILKLWHSFLNSGISITEVFFKVLGGWADAGVALQQLTVETCKSFHR